MSGELETLMLSNESTDDHATEEVINREEEGLQETKEVSEDDEVQEVLKELRDNPEDDVRAAYEELTKGASEEDQAKQADENAAKREARAKLFGQKSKSKESKAEESEDKQQQQQQSEVAIPVGLDAAERADFVKLPPTQQKAVKRILDSAAAKFTRTQQQLKESLEESEDVIKAIKPHMRAWGLRGMSPAQVIMQLAHAQNVLTENREEALIQLANEADIDLAELAKKQRGEVSDVANIEMHPKFRALQEQVNSFNNKFQQAEQQQNNQVIESKAAEVRRFAAEKDALGSQKYPRLQDADFFQRWKQLVVRLGEITPEAEFSERLDRAYRTLAPNDFIPSNNSTRFPAAQGNGKEAIARAKAANVSLRGAGGQSDISSIDTRLIPDSPEATARMAYELITGRSL